MSIEIVPTVTPEQWREDVRENGTISTIGPAGMSLLDMLEEAYRQGQEAVRIADFDPAPDGWDEYEAVNAAQHAANPHRLEGEL